MGRRFGLSQEFCSRHNDEKDGRRRQFSEGRSTRSITRVRTGAFVDSSFRPSCSRTATMRVRGFGSGSTSAQGIPGPFDPRVHSNRQSILSVIPVRSTTVHPSEPETQRGQPWSCCGFHAQCVRCCFASMSAIRTERSYKVPFLRFWDAKGGADHCRAA